jgi:hypothetical protein
MAMESFYKDHLLKMEKIKLLGSKVEAFKKNILSREFICIDPTDPRNNTFAIILDDFEHEFIKGNLAFLEALCNLNDLIAVILFIEMAMKMLHLTSPIEIANRMLGYKIFFVEIENEEQRYAWNRQLMITLKNLISISLRLYQQHGRKTRKCKETGELLFSIIKKVYCHVDWKSLDENLTIYFDSIHPAIEVFRQTILL